MPDGGPLAVSGTPAGVLGGGMAMLSGDLRFATTTGYQAGKPLACCCSGNAPSCAGTLNTYYAPSSPVWCTNRRWFLQRRAAGVSRRLASVASATNGSNRVLTHAARRSTAGLRCAAGSYASCGGRSTSLPSQGRSTSGTTTEPSGRWWFSRMAISARVTATAVPLSVCTKWVPFSPFFL